MISQHLGSRSPSVLPADVSGSVTAILTSTLPGQTRAPRSSLDAVIGARMPSAGQMGPKATAAYKAALVWALLHSGHPVAAVELAERDGMASLQRVAGQAPPGTQSACYAVLAEAYLLSGHLRESVRCGRFALDYADEAGDDGCRFRAEGLLAASLALSGEISAASDAAGRAAGLAEGRGWIESQSAWPLMLGSVLVRARAADATGIEVACESLARNCGTDIIAGAVARFSNVVLQAVRQDNRQIVAACRIIAQGANAALIPPFIVDLAIAMESIAHVHLGDPGAALAVLGDRVSPPDHSVCYELNRATVYLQLGELRKALHVTDVCVSDQPDHNLGTLASVQLRRALAYEGLGLHTQADAEYSKASHLAFEIGAISGTLGLPLPILHTMFARLQANEPDFGNLVAQYLSDSYVYPDRAPLDFTPPPLTGREQVLARWLTTDLSLAEIAVEMQVSTNTVKSQIRTLYKKLDVPSRAEAVMRLERTGIYPRPSRRSSDERPDTGPGPGQGRARH